MDVHMATEIAFRNGYNKAAAELRETAVWIKSSNEKHTFICSKCKVENNRQTKFCPNCGRIIEH